MAREVTVPRSATTPYGEGPNNLVRMGADTRVNNLPIPPAIAMRPAPPNTVLARDLPFSWFFKSTLSLLSGTTLRKTGRHRKTEIALSLQHPEPSVQCDEGREKDQPRDNPGAPGTQEFPRRHPLCPYPNPLPQVPPRHAEFHGLERDLAQRRPEQISEPS